jgi:nuclear pore complex protein Nup85
LQPVQSAQYDAIYHVFQLSEILFLPQDGRGEGLLGEELLDWVNDVDPGTSAILFDTGLAETKLTEV